MYSIAPYAFLYNFALLGGLCLGSLAFFVGFFIGLDFNKAGKSFTDGFLMGLTGTIASIIGLGFVAIVLLLLVSGLS